MRKKIGLILALAGFLLLGLTVPLFGFVVDQAWSHGNMLASISFVFFVGLIGAVLLLVGWNMARRK